MPAHYSAELYQQMLSNIRGLPQSTPEERSAKQLLARKFRNQCVEASAQLVHDTCSSHSGDLGEISPISPSSTCLEELLPLVNRAFVRELVAGFQDNDGSILFAVQHLCALAEVNPKNFILSEWPRWLRETVARELFRLLSRGNSATSTVTLITSPSALTLLIASQEDFEKVTTHYPETEGSVANFHPNFIYREFVIQPNVAQDTRTRFALGSPLIVLFREKSLKHEELHADNAVVMQTFAKLNKGQQRWGGNNDVTLPEKQITSPAELRTYLEYFEEKSLWSLFKDEFLVRFQLGESYTDITTTLTGNHSAYHFFLKMLLPTLKKNNLLAFPDKEIEKIIEVFWKKYKKQAKDIMRWVYQRSDEYSSLGLESYRAVFAQKLSLFPPSIWKEQLEPLHQVDEGVAARNRLFQQKDDFGKKLGKVIFLLTDGKWQTAFDAKKRKQVVESLRFSKRSVGYYFTRALRSPLEKYLIEDRHLIVPWASALSVSRLCQLIPLSSLKALEAEGFAAAQHVLNEYEEKLKEKLGPQRYNELQRDTNPDSV